MDRHHSCGEKKKCCRCCSTSAAFTSVDTRGEKWKNPLSTGEKAEGECTTNGMMEGKKKREGRLINDTGRAHVLSEENISRHI